MAYKISLFDDYRLVSFNGYRSIMNFRNTNNEKEGKKIDAMPEGVELSVENDCIVILINLAVKSHIIGLGAKAFPVDRKRKKFVMLNRDPDTYKTGEDPIYSSIPFFILTLEDKAFGYFVDYPGKIVLDFGVEIYDKIKITVDSKKCDFYLFNGDTPEKILEQYLKLTGSPVLIPKWATGHSISRYSYYPDTVALEVLVNYKKLVPVDSMYFDIHHMQDYKLFTWNKKRFKNPNSFIKSLHERDTKIVTIIDPSIKIDQNYEVFNRLNGTYMETENSEIYSGSMWPGKSAFPDFFNKESRKRWGDEIKRWLEYGVDGIWLDMNEPTVLQGDKIIDGKSIHKCDDGITRKHKEIRNAYPNFQAMATFYSMKEKDLNPFILTRAGYSGIQKYAAMWTGDNISSYDDLYLQMSMVPSLSISGITSCGCDLGGFFSNGNPQLLADYYRMALFFPLYRNHKDIAGNEQEIFLQPPRIRDDIIKSVLMRYKFTDQIYQCLFFSHKYLKPSISPLSFYYWNDETTIHLRDEYMLGDNLIYAPKIENQESREVYIPKGEWIRFSNNEKIIGPAYLKVDDHFPIFVKNNSAIIYDDKILIYGKGSFHMYLGDEFKVSDSDKDKDILIGEKRIQVKAIEISK